jgi:hypothetical protein
MKHWIYINGILVVLLALALWHRHQRTPAQPVLTPPPLATTRPMRIQAPPVSSTSSPSYATPWAALNANDLPSFIEMLRAAGCPEQTVQDIVIIHVSRLNQAKLKPLLDELYSNSCWWKAHPRDESATLNFQELKRNMANQIASLLGVSPLELQSRLQQNSFSPPSWISVERYNTLQQMKSEFISKMAFANIDANSGMTVVDTKSREQLAQLKKDLRTQIEGFLSPAELREYDMRESDAADFVRYSLPVANSEEEYRTMVALTLKYGIPQGVNYSESELCKQIEAALGTEAATRQQKLLEAKNQELNSIDRESFREIDLAVREMEISSAAMELDLDVTTVRDLVERIRTLTTTSPQNRDGSKLSTSDLRALAEQTATETLGPQKAHAFATQFIQMKH